MTERKCFSAIIVIFCYSKRYERKKRASKIRKEIDTQTHTDTEREREKRDLVSLPLSQVHSVALFHHFIDR